MVAPLEVLSSHRASIIALLIFACFALISFESTIVAYIVFGQAHLFLTALHHFRTGKVSNRYVFVSVLCAVLALIYLRFFFDFNTLLLATATLFTLHALWGEFKLRGEAVATSSLISFFGAGLMLWYTVARTIYPDEFWLYGVLTLGLLLLVARMFFFSHPYSDTERYLWFITLLSYGLAYLVGAPGNVFGALIVLHVVNFTLLGHRYAIKGATLRRYWFETLTVFFLTGVAYAAFATHQAPILGVFFLPASYYLWSHGHILLTALLDVLKRFA